MSFPSIEYVLISGEEQLRVPFAYYYELLGASGYLQSQIGSGFSGAATVIYVTTAVSGLQNEINLLSGHTFDQLTGTSGYLQSQITNLYSGSGYLQTEINLLSALISGGSASGVTQSQLSGLSGYLQAEISSLQTQLSAIDTGSIASLTGLSGNWTTYLYVNGAVSGLSGYVTGQIGQTNSNLGVASGYLQGEVNTLSGLLSNTVGTGAFNALSLNVSSLTGLSGNWATISYTTGVSGFLQSEIDTLTAAVTGNTGSAGALAVRVSTLEGQTGSWATISYASGRVATASGTLQSQINALTTNVGLLTGQSGNWATRTYVDNASGSLQAGIDGVNSALVSSGFDLSAQIATLQNAGYATTGQLNSVSGALNTRIISITNLTGAWATTGYVTGASGYLQSEINIVSGLLTGASVPNVSGVSGLLYRTGVAALDWFNRVLITSTGSNALDWENRFLRDNWFANDPVLSGHVANKAYVDIRSGVLQGYIDVISGIATGAAGGGISFGQLSGASGYLQGEIDTANGFISTLTGQSGSWATTGYVSRSSGSLQSYIDIVSGIATGAAGGGISFGQLSGASGYLQSEINTSNGYISSLTGQSGSWATRTYVDNGINDLSGVLQGEITILNGYTGASGVLRSDITVLQSFTGASGVLRADITPLQTQVAFLTGLSGAWATTAYVGNVSGTLQNYIDVISGIATGAAGGGISFGQLSGASGYLQSEIDIVSGLAGNPAAGDSISTSIIQSGHGFSVGDIVRYNGSGYVKAKADSDINAEVIAMVAGVSNANTFKALSAGHITGLSGLSAGTTYFLSPSTSGALTATEPTNDGEISKPLFIATSTADGYFINMRGLLLANEEGGGGGGGGGDVTQAGDNTFTGDNEFQNGVRITQPGFDTSRIWRALYGGNSSIGFWNNGELVVGYGELQDIWMRFFVDQSVFQLSAGWQLGWGTSSASVGDVDTGLRRAAPGAVEVNNGTPGDMSGASIATESLVLSGDLPTSPPDGTIAFDGTALNLRTGGAWNTLVSGGAGTPLLGSCIFDPSSGSISGLIVSGIVASVTRLSTGLYQVTFTSAQGAYTVSPVATGDLIAATFGYLQSVATVTSTSVQVQFVGAGGTARDPQLVNITIFGPALSTGGMILLEQHTASSSATLDFTTAISGLYDEYLVELVGIVPATNGVEILCRFSTDGGATFIAGTSYSWAGFRQSNAGNAGAGGNGLPQFNLTAYGTQTNSTTTGGFSGSFKVFNPLGGTAYTRIRGDSVLNDGTGSPDVLATFAGSFTSTSAVNAIRILASSGNIASGTVRIYGLAK